MEGYQSQEKLGYSTLVSTPQELYLLLGFLSQLNSHHAFQLPLDSFPPVPCDSKVSTDFLFCYLGVDMASAMPHLLCQLFQSLYHKTT